MKSRLLFFSVSLIGISSFASNANLLKCARTTDVLSTQYSGVINKDGALSDDLVSPGKYENKLGYWHWGVSVSEFCAFKTPDQDLVRDPASSSVSDVWYRPINILVGGHVQSVGIIENKTNSNSSSFYFSETPIRETTEANVAAADCKSVEVNVKTGLIDRINFNLAQYPGNHPRGSSEEGDILNYCAVSGVELAAYRNRVEAIVPQRQINTVGSPVKVKIKNKR